MPIIKSAIKKLRKDRKREKENDARKAALESAIRIARKSGSKINEAYSVIDRAVKRNIIHKNRAARIKASLSKLARPSPSKKTTSKAPVVKTVKKATRSTK